MHECRSCNSPLDITNYRRVFIIKTRVHNVCFSCVILEHKGVWRFYFKRMDFDLHLEGWIESCGKCADVLVSDVELLGESKCNALTDKFSHEIYSLVMNFFVERECLPPPKSHSIADNSSLKTFIEFKDDEKMNASSSSGDYQLGYVFYFNPGLTKTGFELHKWIFKQLLQDK